MSETATFAAGCFWGIEEAFRQINGVEDTAVGYMGGTLEDPSYQDVCTGTTGHAEVVQIVFDPERVSYEELIDVFWSNHDATTPDRQGVDVGSQYRSAIFFHSPEDEATAHTSLDNAESSGRFDDPIVTEITPASTFWRAEDYHQRYLEKRGRSSCEI